MWCVLLCLFGQEPRETAQFPRERQAQVRSATVRVVDRSPRGGTGSGALVGFDSQFAYILTSHHVIDPGDRLQVEWVAANGAKRVNTAVEVLAKSARSDLGVLRVRLETGVTPPLPLPICPVEQNGLSDVRVMSAGCDHGQVPTCTMERLKGRTLLPRSNAYSAFWLTDGPIVHGRSGGPLVDAGGNLIGICRGGLAATKDQPAEGLFVAIEEIHAIVLQAGASHLIRDSRVFAQHRPQSPLVQVTR